MRPENIKLANEFQNHLLLIKTIKYQFLQEPELSGLCSFQNLEQNKAIKSKNPICLVLLDEFNSWPELNSNQKTLKKNPHNLGLNH